MSTAEKLRSDWPSAIVAVLGVLVLLAPFIVGGTTQGTQFSAIFTGIFLIGYGAYDVYQKQIWGQRLARYWAMGAVGLWAIASPYVVKSTAAVRYVNLVAGVATIVFAGLQLFRKTERDIDVPDFDTEL